MSTIILRNAKDKELKMSSMAEKYANNVLIKNLNQVEKDLKHVVRKIWIGLDMRVLQREFEDGSICEVENVDGELVLETYTPHKRFVLSEER